MSETGRSPSSEPNPPDCICEYQHASCTYCPSTVPSTGAVPDSDRAVMTAPARTDS